eukprot:1250652-Rhodomonas_salina.2
MLFLRPDAAAGSIAPPVRMSVELDWRWEMRVRGCEARKGGLEEGKFKEWRSEEGRGRLLYTSPSPRDRG